GSIDVCQRVKKYFFDTLKNCTPLAPGGVQFLIIRIGYCLKAARRPIDAVDYKGERHWGRKSGF
ncbi:MAG: hypothetical protein MJ085_04940, partial [Clostridia bacterium]|nr:hypothetical protein [Clostridia bacterium]